MAGLPNHGPFGELDVTEWIGEAPGSLAELRGRAGDLRFHRFGQVDDLTLGAAVGALVA